MLLEAARNDVVRFARRMIPDGLSMGTSGNISIRDEQLIAITPSAVPYDEMRPEQVCVVDLGGTVVDGPANPSSELPMHLALQAGGRGLAVVHTHPMYATTLSTVVKELPAIHYLVARLGGSVRVAPYATFGTQDLAENVLAGLEGRFAVIMANHGAVTIGDTLSIAYARSVMLEWLSRLYFQALTAGNPVILSESEMESAWAMMERRRQQSVS